MYLSKLEIIGFKSFANKVNLSFDSGITAIVGPNGCGKTNVVDAIRWALGEQKPSTLRSDKMEDVIFNGTKNRKAIGMADVSLTIENTKGILPTEYSEVKITRRVFRSGDSEYYLNNTLCRLKDIKDLFMDTGMGSDAYSVIELKMIETILSDKADERRRLFEEAAGVTKYKYRRKEAYRRLDDVQQDLLRVNDIVKEVQKSVNSLERQAHKAEQYNTLHDDLKVLEVALLEREYALIFSTVEPLREQLRTATTEKNRIHVTLTEEETLLDSLRADLERLEENLNEATMSVAAQQEKINMAQQERVKASERCNALNNTIERNEKEKIDLRQQAEELEKRTEELNTALESTNKKVDEASIQYAKKKEELDAFTVQLDEKKAELKVRQDTVIALLHSISEKRQQYERTKARLENINGRIEYSSEENELYREEILRNKTLVAELSAQDRELRHKFAESELQLHSAENSKLSLQKEQESLRNREFELRSLLDRRRARLDFLKGLIESFEGYSEGAKFLVTDDAWKSYVRTTVADAITTDAQYRVAVESLLGEIAGFLVVDTMQEATRGIEYLKTNHKGRATFICLDMVPQTPVRIEPISGDGIIGWARDLVRCDSMYSSLSDFLFGETVIVRDTASASSLIRKRSNLRCVTLDGELITGQGIVKGGSARVEDGGIIGKKQQIFELEEELLSLTEQIETVRSEIAVREHTLSTVDSKSLVDEVKKIEQQMTAVEMRIAQIEYEKKRIEENIQRNETEHVKLQAESADLQQELDDVLPQIAGLEKEKSQAEQQAGAAISELETMEVLWSQYSKVANEAHVKLLHLENEEKKFARELEYTSATISNIQNTLTQRDIEITEAKEEIGRLTKELVSNESEITQLTKEHRAISERRKGITHEYNAKRNQVHSIELKIKDERRLHDSSLSLSHELDMKISELTLKAENLSQRAKEEFEFDLMLKEFPADETFDIEGMKEEVREMKEKIRSLGAVNFAAFDEFKTEKERMDFITAQRDDLIESEKTLVTTIEEINTTAQKAFLDTFGRIRENFINTFKGLFDEGDECDLRLEDGVDPLEARIEIIAKPRGKRPTSIDLLSGGEKTLTAIALLFAIYLVKPSPFCILDEVDAPLDDSNIDRFSRILRKFSDNTQFIVVTHNKRTMESANAMYGVTMEEEGVSKLVSVRFNENKVRQN